MNDENKQFWRFENSADNSNEATLYVYGDIVHYDLGEYNWPDDVVPNKFKNELNALGDVGTINVRINSGGGSVFAAYAIMNLLKSHKAQIITHNDGIAASAATIIAMAGDKIVSALGSFWMVHLPATIVFGNAKELQKAIDLLNVITENMIDIYRARTGIERTELESMMNEDTWMTGAQAKEKGFVDEVTDFEVAACLGTDKQTAFFNGLPVDLAKIRNKEKFVAMLPTKETAKPQGDFEIFANAVAEQVAAALGTDSTKNNHEQEEIVMTLEVLKAQHPEVYGAAVEAGIEQAAVAEAFINARAEGATAERERIKEIDDMALPGMEDLTNKAKYETGITAAEFAMELIKAQKQKGINYLADAKADAAEAGKVPSAGAPPNDEAEADALLAYAEEHAKTIRK